MNQATERPRIAALVSGRGRNLQALIDAVADGRIEADWAGVISNRPGAAALDRCQAAGVPAEVVDHTAYDSREAFDAALAAVLSERRPDLVVMAGFMRVLGAGFIDAFVGRMINVHPSLLPKYRGLHTHRRALEAGDAEHGASVHFVTAELDGGPVAIQGRFTVAPDDDESRLAERVMNEVELKILPQAVAWFVRGELRCDADGARFRGRPLTRPLSLDDVEADFR